MIYFSACSKSDTNQTISVIVERSTFDDFLSIEGTAEPIQTTNVICPQNVDGTIIFLIEDGVIVEAGQVVCILEDKNLESEYDDAVTNLESAIAEFNKVKANLEMQYTLLEADVRNNQAQTEIAFLDSLQLRYSSETMRRIRELELEKASIEKRKLQSKLKNLQEIQQSEIRKHQLIIQRHQRNVDSRKQRLESLTLTAPSSGIVRRAFNRQTWKQYQEGDNVWTGRAILTIPDNEKMKVLFMASEADYKRININDKIEYSFDAMPSNMGWGKVTKKATIGNPIRRDSKVRFFEIEASVDSLLEPLSPGQSVNCKIILRTVADTIVIPQIAIFEADSTRVVYIPIGKYFEKREIQTSLSSPKEAIITHGLNAGEKISLSRPDRRLVREITLLPDSVKTQNDIKKQDLNNDNHESQNSYQINE